VDGWSSGGAEAWLNRPPPSSLRLPAMLRPAVKVGVAMRAGRPRLATDAVAKPSCHSATAKQSSPLAPSRGALGFRKPLPIRETPEGLTPSRKGSQSPYDLLRLCVSFLQPDDQRHIAPSFVASSASHASRSSRGARWPLCFAASARCHGLHVVCPEPRPTASPPPDSRARILRSGRDRSSRQSAKP